MWKAKNIARDHESGYGPREFGLERWTRLLIRKLAAYVPAASSFLSLSRTETRPTFPSAPPPPLSTRSPQPFFQEAALSPTRFLSDRGSMATRDGKVSRETNLRQEISGRYSP